jgi:hypothetical protein
MTRWKWILGLTVALFVFAWSQSTSSYRFRMTVEIETPQGIRTGSSVMEEGAYKTLNLTSEEHGGGGYTHGEAVVVDLPDGPVFALLTLGDGEQPLGYAVTNALVPDMKQADIDAYVATVAKLGRIWSGRVKADLPRLRDKGAGFRGNGWPVMVRFRDIHDPKTAERVEPQAIGVKRIWVETTSEPVTRGIEKRLGWLEGYNKRSEQWLEDYKKRGGRFEGIAISTKELPDNLTADSFSTEIK